jgi:GTP-binding protein HflX
MEIKSSIRNKKAILFITHHPFANPVAIAQVEEFKELGRAAGLQSKKVSYQVLKKINPATLIGTGKIQELKETIKETQVELIVFDHSLSGIQLRNLEKGLEVMIIDRNQLILDIFSQRAHTYAGKLQVELARTLDELPRMVGAWMSSLSRQGGGIGTRGPGEKAIEIDRRQVQLRARTIRQKLEKIRRVRKGHRALRKRNNIPSIALIGYTNSGKSTLLNTLTHTSSVTVKNLPFMTLDPTTRKVHISNSQNVLCTDTVGFIQNLSPHLIEAFKATLEESASADILLHVIDLSSPLMKVQMETVNKLIYEFGWDQKPCIHVYNKMDIAPKEKVFQTNSHSKVFISALKRTGLDKLKKTIGEVVSNLQTEEVQLYFPKNEEDKVYSLDRKAFIYKKEVSSLGVLCYVRMGVAQLREWEDFIIKS